MYPLVQRLPICVPPNPGVGHWRGGGGPTRDYFARRATRPPPPNGPIRGLHRLNFAEMYLDPVARVETVCLQTIAPPSGRSIYMEDYTVTRPFSRFTWHLTRYVLFWPHYIIWNGLMFWKEEEKRTKRLFIKMKYVHSQFWVIHDQKVLIFKQDQGSISSINQGEFKS